MEKPVLVPVVPPEAPPCVRSEPPRPPADAFQRCVMPEITACLTRTQLEALVLYLEESWSWADRAYRACGPDAPDAGVTETPPVGP